MAAVRWGSNAWALLGEKWRVPAARRFVVTYVGYASLYAVRKPFSVVKTDIQRQLGLSTYWLGLIDTTFLTAYAVGQFCIPVLAANWNLPPHNVLLGLYIGSGAAAIAFGFSSNALTFAFLWLINGLMNSAAFPLLVDRLSSSIEPAYRGRVIGAWTTSQQVGAFLATIFAAYVGHHVHWRAVFIFPGLFILAAGALLKFTLTPDPIDRSTNARRPTSAAYVKASPPPIASNSLTKPANEVELAAIQRATSISSSDTSSGSPPADPSSPKSRLKSGKGNLLDILGDIIRADDVKAIAMSYFFVKMVRYSMLFWLPYYLSTSLGYTVDTAGYASVLFDIGGFFGGLTAGYIADGIARGRRLAVAAMACVGTAVALMCFVAASHSRPTTALLLMSVIGMFNSGADSLIGGSAPADVCERAALPDLYVASASGIVNGFGSIGSVVQGYLTAHLSETRGWGALYGSLSGAALLGALCLVRAAIHESTFNRRLKSGYADEIAHITVRP